MTTKKTATKKPASKPSIVGKYVIARCSAAGVHAGIVQSTDASHTVLTDARRLWYWKGAASLSEAAVYGLNPSKCAESKIGAKVPELRLRDSDIAELIVCTPAGQASIKGMPEWRA